MHVVRDVGVIVLVSHSLAPLEILTQSMMHTVSWNGTETVSSDVWFPYRGLFSNHYKTPKVIQNRFLRDRKTNSLIEHESDVWQIRIVAVILREFLNTVRHKPVILFCAMLLRHMITGSGREIVWVRAPWSEVGPLKYGIDWLELPERLQLNVDAFRLL